MIFGTGSSSFGVVYSGFDLIFVNVKWEFRWVFGFLSWVFTKSRHFANNQMNFCKWERFDSTFMIRV